MGFSKLLGAVTGGVKSAGGVGDFFKKKFPVANGITDMFFGSGQPTVKHQGQIQQFPIFMSGQDMQQPDHSVNPFQDFFTPRGY